MNSFGYVNFPGLSGENLDTKLKVIAQLADILKVPFCLADTNLYKKGNSITGTASEQQLVKFIESMAAHADRFFITLNNSGTNPTYLPREQAENLEKKYKETKRGGEYGNFFRRDY